MARRVLPDRTVRRAKLSYLRKRVGKATRLIETRRELGEGEASAEAEAPSGSAEAGAKA